MNKSGKFAQNGGQIAKEYLLYKAKNGFKLTYKGKDEKKDIVRRRLKRVANTTVPNDISAKKVILTFKQQYSSLYNIVQLYQILFAFLKGEKTAG